MYLTLPLTTVLRPSTTIHLSISMFLGGNLLDDNNNALYDKYLPTFIPLLSLPLSAFIPSTVSPAIKNDLCAS